MYNSEEPHISHQSEVGGQKEFQFNYQNFLLQQIHVTMQMQGKSWIVLPC